ncbi:MAG: SMP-30/gluconolactonase/LRE family protein [Bacteroidetes bacterium]|nr:SMP-30/gluconolactonase/LRE family protein [Bacteroidota bacterium]
MDDASIVKNGAKLVKIGSGFIFTEGPAVDKMGNVFFTDQPNNTIVKWSANSGQLNIFSDNSGRANGLYFDQNGNLLACADMDNQIWSFSPDGKHKVLLDSYDGKKLNGPNDLWVHPNGGIFFTDPLYKRNYWTRNPERQQDGEHVYFMSQDGKIVERVETTLVKPNGIVGSANGKLLYVSDIGGKKTYSYRINKKNQLINKKLFAEMGSDGMTLDQKGNVYLTGDGVTVFNKKGVKIAHIPVTARWTANVCFGGSDKSTLFITAMDGLYTIDMNVKGL